MSQSGNNETDLARQLTDGFLSGTGIAGSSGNPERRYLWTDAIAVQVCFALSHVLKEKIYYQHALKLIEQVHHVLGRHRPEDDRNGWISGLPEEEGKMHPTFNGLRIGKPLPERSAKAPFSSKLEWDRDGQYFHYLTRWFDALLRAYKETEEKKFALWAVELIQAGGKFIHKNNNKTSMVWKMNIDLSRTAVESMGAHDPLEGLICVIRAIKAVPERQHELEPLKNDFEKLCNGRNWFTHDSLGIGGLLLDTKKSLQLKQKNEWLPAEIRPKYLFAAAMAGLKFFSEQVYHPRQPVSYRLAFRECGMALGINALFSLHETLPHQEVNLKSLGEYVPLAAEIDQFWARSTNRATAGWKDHEDINTITLAASLLASKYPQGF